MIIITILKNIVICLVSIVLLFLSNIIQYTVASIIVTGCVFFAIGVVYGEPVYTFWQVGKVVYLIACLKAGWDTSIEFEKLFREAVAKTKNESY